LEALEQQIGKLTSGTDFQTWGPRMSALLSSRPRARSISRLSERLRRFSELALKTTDYLAVADVVPSGLEASCFFAPPRFGRGLDRCMRLGRC